MNTLTLSNDTLLTVQVALTLRAEDMLKSARESKDNPYTADCTFQYLANAYYELCAAARAVGGCILKPEVIG